MYIILLTSHTHKGYLVMGLGLLQVFYKSLTSFIHNMGHGSWGRGHGVGVMGKRSLGRGHGVGVIRFIGHL